jgi:hypothetical protein
MFSGKAISILLCDRHKLNIVCGIQLKEAGTTALKHTELLQDVFEQINKPLLEFPFANNISVAEISEQVRPLISSSAIARNCPKCGKEMVMRKAIKGGQEDVLGVYRVSNLQWNFPDRKILSRLFAIQLVLDDRSYLFC